jgi:serine/threonine protein kinase
MEYVEGLDLRRLLAATGKIPAGPALEIASEVASALHVTYNGVGPDNKPLKLLHRDIKPSNIQVTTAGETKVLDFGVARADFEAREAETRSLVFGSIGYMAPERLDLIDGPEGDIYGLGSVLYEMLTATRFGKTSGKESRHKARLLEALDTVWDATGGQNEELVRLIESMMAYEPAHRPSARDVERSCAALRRQIGGELFPDWCERVVQPAVVEERARAQERPTMAAVVSEDSGPAKRVSPAPLRPQPVSANEGPVLLPEDTLDSPAHATTGSHETIARTAGRIDFRNRPLFSLAVIAAFLGAAMGLGIVAAFLFGHAFGW